MTIRIPRPQPDNWDFGITYAKKFPPYVYSANGTGCLIHKVQHVQINWWTRDWNYLIRLDTPVMIAQTICGMHKRIEPGRMRSALCALPKPEAVLCGKCHGQPANFPRKNPESKAQRRIAKRNLGCIALSEE
jgi:hypothetical protein